jgi:lactobin A/cerein 7B family class IIb bacteriocin
LLIVLISLKTKKMSLENLNLVELNAQEVENTDGGTVVPIDPRVVGYAAGIAYFTLHQAGDFVRGFANGW